MTKEEFLTMVNEELEKLEQEYHAAIKKIGNVKTEELANGEYNNLKYQLDKMGQKIGMVTGLVTLPAIARIQAMSDVEIEEYKKEKIDDLELKIKEIEAQEIEEREKLAQLKAEQQQLISRFGSLYGKEREQAILRGQQLSKEVSKYEAKGERGIFALFKREIEEVRKQQEEIKLKSSQRVKQDLLTEIKRSHSLIENVDIIKRRVDPTLELQASVASDPQKAQQMADLLTEYRRLSDSQREITGFFPLCYGLPRELENMLSESAYYDSATKEVTDPDKLIEIVENFEPTFEDAKTNFMEQFTEQKLFKLAGKEYGVESPEVDMDFLQQHADKIGANKLNRLQILINQKKKLSKKIFKTKNIKKQIKNLDEQIIEKQSDMYKEIIGWYESQSREILGIYGVQFGNLESLQQSLAQCRGNISRTEQAIIEIKQRILNAKAKMEQQKQEYETKKDKITQQIRELGGERFKDTKIPYAFDQSRFNLEDIMTASNVIYQKNIINNVEQEAQRQADIKEAELRGITLEQLYQMRQQAQLSAGNEMPLDEDISNGMKR